MSDLGAIARPYAEAVFSLAKDNASWDKWQNALELIAELADNEDLKSALSNPVVAKADKQSLLVDLVKKAGGDDEVSRFVELLVDNERLPAATNILSRYSQLRHEIENELDVTVESAIEMSADKQKALADSLAKRFGKKINMQVSINEKLIGGTIIHAGDTVIDDSVKSKLERLSSTLRK